MMRTSGSGARRRDANGGSADAASVTASKARGAKRALWRFLAALLAAWTATTSAAFAHPELEAGRRLASELELEEAVAAFDRALTSGSLTRAELCELLAERALILHALRAREPLIRDFQWLAALAPQHRLDLRAPPELVALWTSIRDQGSGPLGVEVTARLSPLATVEAVVALTGTVPPDAHARLVWRRGGEPWQTVEGSELRQPLAPRASFELYAEVVGPGGMIVARAHGPDSPLHLTRAPTPVPKRAELPPLPERSRPWGRFARPGLIGTACALTAAAIVATVFAVRARQDEPTRATDLQPMVEF